jgi:hypothetical protein
VLAGLAPSSQTVGSNKRILGATKSGSFKLPQSTTMRHFVIVATMRHSDSQHSVIRHYGTRHFVTMRQYDLRQSSIALTRHFITMLRY